MNIPFLAISCVPSDMLNDIGGGGGGNMQKNFFLQGFIFVCVLILKGTASQESVNDMKDSKAIKSQLNK